MYVFIAVFVAGVMALWGWRKGLLHLVLRLSALLLAYALTWQEAPYLARHLVDKGWLSGVLAWPVAGLTLFLGGSLLFAAAARWLGSLVPEEWHNKGKPAGVVAGMLLGAGLGVLMVWTTGALQDAWLLRTANENQANKQTQLPVSKPQESALGHLDQTVRHWSNDAMATMAQRALGDSPAATVATQWVRDPLSMSEGLQHLANKPELHQLFQNPAGYAVLVKGSNADIQRLPAFQALMDDPQVMQFLSAAGLPGATLSQQSQALAGMLSRYAGNFEKLRTTPEFQALVQNPDLRQKLRQGNLLVLLTDDKMRQLASMLTQDNAAPEQVSQAEVSKKETAPVQPIPEKKLYQWKDERGRVHITEDQPPEGVEADVIQL